MDLQRPLLDKVLGKDETDSLCVKLQAVWLGFVSSTVIMMCFWVD